ncbi:MAG: transposase [Roseiflexaceae bacterium]|nr:transposase [Roseiflexaceae bacterium]
MEVVDVARCTPGLHHSRRDGACRTCSFPKGTVYLRVRDALGPLFTNPEFADLFPNNGAPAQAPAHLALITVMQFAEGLADRQAADAVRGRIDGKYALALELTDPGFDASVLCDFRARLIAGGAEQRLFEGMLVLFKEQGLLKARGRQRTDATHVLAAVHVLNRLECIGETLRHTLNSLASSAPDWLRAWVPSCNEIGKVSPRISVTVRDFCANEVPRSPRNTPPTKFKYCT